ncbi:lytic polysaccharide monooxygenase [Paenibacillus assamensis]|uniref:lytic polysaccharide monooxygenase n=1 Tax=Paenibacillus assamensis TaxID=311244 RepID=UPI00040F1406|nr:lytic polysaccharide monooxygenase [Paenibacillus assamensis]
MKQQSTLKSLFSGVSPLLVVLGTFILLGVGSLAAADKASAHGYMESPSSRALLCKQGTNTKCGAIQYEPQSVEAIGNFPAAGPKDGEITGGGIFPELYEQTADRWQKQTLNSGKQTFTWHLTAPHATKEWKYYITKKDWNPNKPLTRADLEQFCYYYDGGKKPSKTTSHECEVPSDRSGYHLILGVWEIADTPNAFYQVIDVNLVNDGTAPVEPITAPKNVVAKAISATSVEINWTASAKAAAYEVYRNGTLVNTVNQTTFTDNGLTASTAYSYTVRAVDAAGKKSPLSSAVSVTTLPSDNGNPGNPNPGTPGNGTLPAWDAAKVYVGGDKVQYNGLEYQAAYWTQGNTPDNSDAWKLISNVTLEWNAKKAYVGGAKVTFNGVTYQAAWWTQGEEPGKAGVWKVVTSGTGHSHHAH